MKSQKTPNALHFFVSTKDDYATVALVRSQGYPDGNDNKGLAVIGNFLGISGTQRLLGEMGVWLDGVEMSAAMALLLLGAGAKPWEVPEETTVPVRMKKGKWEQAPAYLHHVSCPAAAREAALGLLVDLPWRREERQKWGSYAVGNNAAFSAIRDRRPKKFSFGTSSVPVPERAVGVVFVGDVMKTSPQEGIAFLSATGQVLAAWIREQNGPRSSLYQVEPDTQKVPWGTPMGRVRASSALEASRG